ncbi:hypothetical protein [Rubellimicrobium arenae]|uniref:hypothetical protein n=1 Tax=Rubellimicrobium arenae TaxID=2817372 RepID=UPI001B30AC0B|nr:hypothetical protein [Rubellimicrobium arenae]
MPNTRRMRRPSPPLLTPGQFAARVAGFTAFGLGGIGLALALGTWGYHDIAGLSWVDSVFNASMILSGMGPANAMPTDRAKIFASIYALCAGLAWTALLSVIVYPFVQRMLHALHLEMNKDDET